MDYDDYADEEWVEDDVGEDEDDLLACPSCGRAVHEDTQQCPYCGDWIVPVPPDRTAKRLIWTVAAGLVILALILMTVL